MEKFIMPEQQSQKPKPVIDKSKYPEEVQKMMMSEEELAAKAEKGEQELEAEQAKITKLREEITAAGKPQAGAEKRAEEEYEKQVKGN